jgi:putative addiction module component (TIGR02574 family)
MSSETQAVFDAALALPETDRALLVERLLESLPPDADELTEEEFAAELDRRHAEFLRDPSIGIPWEEVRRQILDEQ